MDSIEIKLIQIHWDGPFKLSDLPSLMNTETDYGVYQIYGKHTTYGNDVLLYIGKADRQTFGIRIPQENWIDTNDSNNTKVYIGRMHGSKTPCGNEWSLEIDLAERLLIYVHKPAYNASGVSTIRDVGIQNLHILNWGHHRDLLPELSGNRWTSKLDSFDYQVYRWNE
ncbi:hypothetical protein NCCP2222_19020 [Sporosarcina sp. NCCP-2222]|uniref:hypothetical protein n=1 Tax=Sporosarcina sp. NCCP-2222 TaxID=2935073 RepID=UPI00207EF509|nr:hypothetical protein [Sporosarcina sp. NCCP-2222]GKV55955.1 hypothetical protein NCCP2222_19020 [Sporosarcina sp. NCCP-2222]